jgi:hypothetical protein
MLEKSLTFILCIHKLVNPSNVALVLSFLNHVQMIAIFTSIESFSNLQFQTGFSVIYKISINENIDFLKFKDVQFQIKDFLLE